MNANVRDEVSAPLWANSRLRLAIAGGCNIRCYYCHNEGQPKSSSFMSDRLFEHVLELIQTTDRRISSVTITGGEPLLHSRLTAFLSALAPHVEHRTVITNGWLLDERKLCELNEASVGKLRIGVDSLMRAKSRPTAGPASGKRMVDIIAMARAFGILVELNVVVTKFNADEIGPLINFCVTEGISVKFFEQVMTNKYGVSTPQPVIAAEQFSAIAQRQRNIGAPYLDPHLGAANHVYPFPGGTLRYCKFLCPYGLCAATGTRVDPMGNVYACMNGHGSTRIEPHLPIKLSAARIRGVLASGCVKSRSAVGDRSSA